MYVDGFVVPVPKRKLNAYLKLARLARKVWKEHGALEYREAVADDVPYGKRTSFPQRQGQGRRDGNLFLDRLQIARRPRQGDEESDGRQALRRHGHEEDAV